MEGGVLLYGQVLMAGGSERDGRAMRIKVEAVLPYGRHCRRIIYSINMAFGTFSRLYVPIRRFIREVTRYIGIKSAMSAQ